MNTDAGRGKKYVRLYKRQKYFIYDKKCSPKGKRANEGCKKPIEKETVRA